MNEYFYITYATSLGKNKTIRIDYPNFELTPAQIRAAAFDLMSGNIFDKEKTGSLTSISKIEKVKVIRNSVL